MITQLNNQLVALVFKEGTMGKISIYTDGACSVNPGPGGWGFNIYDVKGNCIFSDSGNEKYSTNQRMELIACIAGINKVIITHSPPFHIDLYTDSAYICNCIQDQWYIKWEGNGWYNAKGEPVKNRDLWEALLTLMRFPSVDIKFIKVKAHSGDPKNEAVDKLAKAAIRR